MAHRSIILAIAALAIGSAIAQVSTVPVATNTGDVAANACPAKNMAPPIYPPEAFRHFKGGTTVLSLALDDCGRVLDVRVAKQSGTAALDYAAKIAAKGWILGPVAPEELVDGRLETPVDFTVSNILTPRQMGWPSTHKKPRYLLDPPSNDLTLIKPVEEMARLKPDRSQAPPYKGLPGSFVATGTKAAPEFWLLPIIEERVDTAVRYRPVMENGEPVVHLLVVCNLPAEVCATNTAFFMEGLPFAKARK